MARRGERHRSVGGRGTIFQPHWAFQRLGARRYERHHENIIRLVKKLPCNYKDRFTVRDLLENYWKDEGLDSQSASILIQIIHRVGVLDAKGMSDTNNRLWEVNENFLKLRQHLKKLGGEEVYESVETNGETRKGVQSTGQN